MKNFNRKSMLVIACIALVMTITVGGTLAYLIAADGPVTNTFEPTKVTCGVLEGGKDNPNTTEVTGLSTKTNVQIKNTGDTDAYIRAAVVGNWYIGTGDDKKIVAPWKVSDGTFEGWLSGGWTDGGDGYYYYNGVVTPSGTDNDTTGYLFTKLTPPANVPVEGAHLEVTIVCQAVQAKGLPSDVDTAVEAFTYVKANDPAGN